MLAAFSALVPVILLIVAGFWLRRTLLPEEMQWNGIERLTYYILFPALIIDTLARADLSRVPIWGVGGALFLAILLMTGLCLALRPWLAVRFGIGGPGSGKRRSWPMFAGIGTIRIGHHARGVY